MDHKCDWECLKKVTVLGYPEECRKYENSLMEETFKKIICTGKKKKCLKMSAGCCGELNGLT
jgi:hypothetical protein